jgi:hypothetical protein
LGETLRVEVGQSATEEVGRESRVELRRAKFQKLINFTKIITYTK